MDILKNLIEDRNTNPMDTSINSVGDLLGVAWNVVLAIGIAMSVLAFIMAGIKFVMSRGDPKAMDTAKKHLTYSVIGLVITLGAYTLLYLVINVSGAEYESQPIF